MPPSVLIPKIGDPRLILGITPSGALTPWGPENTTYQVAMGSSQGMARLAVHAGLLRYDGGRFLDQTSGDEVSPDDVLTRYGSELEKKAGPRWLEGRPILDADGKETGREDPVWWGGVVPEGMRDVKAHLGITGRKAFDGTTFEPSAPMIDKMSENSAYLLYAAARAAINGSLSLEQLFGDRRNGAVGSALGQGIPGLREFTDLILAAAGGKTKSRNVYDIANILQGGLGGTLTAMLGPSCDPDNLPPDLSPDMGVPSWGPFFHGSGECATFGAMLTIASNAMRPPFPGQSVPLMMAAGAAEAPHGRPMARPGQVGFHTMKATEGLEGLRKRGADTRLWRGYAPFTDASGGFWMGEGAALNFLVTLDFAVRNGIPLDGILGGFALYGDQGKKVNVARLGVGILNAGLEAFRMATAAGIPPEWVRYASLHGTATPETNRLEPDYLVRLLKAVNALTPGRKVKITALKAFLTHLLGAASGAELAIILQGLRHQRLPGLFNLAGNTVTIPPELLEFIDASESPLEAPIEAALLFSEGFWGNNFAAIVAAVTEELLQRFGYTPDEIRSYLERVAEKRVVAGEIDRQILAGKRSYLEVLAGAAFV